MKSLIALVLISALTATPSADKVQLYTQKINETKVATTTLSDTLKYFDTAITLNEQDSKLIESELGADATMSAKTTAHPGIDLQTFLAYPFDSIGYMFTHIFGSRAQKTSDKQHSLKLQETEALKNKLSLQRSQLQRLQSEKAYLLALTKNDEAMYQELLNSALAEQVAQQDILSGKAKETKIGTVKTGAKIASIISGASACSTGTHLHFEVRQNDVSVDPANFLSTVAHRYTIPPEHLPQFVGTWAWPVLTPVVITQEYGMSWFARPGGYTIAGSYAGAPHSGIDMLPESGKLDVIAPVSGTLYTGTTPCGGGTLSYVRLQVSPALSLFFLHTKGK